jgi:CheY-like chemotaxis protein
MGAPVRDRTRARATVWCPRAPAAGQDGRPGGHGAAGSLRGKRVLLADDNRTNRFLLRLILDSAGTRVTEAEDGAQAVAAWAAGSFDILLFDIMMPVLSGVDALTQIRSLANPATPDQVAIAVTTDVTPAALRRYRAAGFDACAPKPILAGDFLALLEEICAARAGG